MKITPFYAVAATVLLFVLFVRVVRERRQHGVAVGGGGVETLERAIRAHANAAENTPLALILLLLLELNGGWPWLLHVLGAAFLAARLLHARNISRTNEQIHLRVVAMVANWAVMAALGVTALVLGLRSG